MGMDTFSMGSSLDRGPFPHHLSRQGAKSTKIDLKDDRTGCTRPLRRMQSFYESVALD
jgi:hypothetical protein